jgi:hypothetical protein
MAFSLAQLQTMLMAAFKPAPELAWTKASAIGYWLNSLRSQFPDAYLSELAVLGLREREAAFFIGRAHVAGRRPIVAEPEVTSATVT